MIFACYLSDQLKLKGTQFQSFGQNIISSWTQHACEHARWIYLQGLLWNVPHILLILYRDTVIVAAHAVAVADTSCLFQTLIPMHHRSVHWQCSVQVHLIKFVSNMSIGFHLHQPQNAINFLPHGKHPFNWSKMGQNSANTICIHLEDNLDHGGKKLEELLK